MADTRLVVSIMRPTKLHDSVLLHIARHSVDDDDATEFSGAQGELWEGCYVLECG